MKTLLLALTFGFLTSVSEAVPLTTVFPLNTIRSLATDSLPSDGIRSRDLQVLVDFAKHDEAKGVTCELTMIQPSANSYVHLSGGDTLRCIYDRTTVEFDPTLPVQKSLPYVEDGQYSFEFRRPSGEIYRGHVTMPPTFQIASPATNTRYVAGEEILLQYAQINTNFGSYESRFLGCRPNSGTAPAPAVEFDSTFLKFPRGYTSGCNSKTNLIKVGAGNYGTLEAYGENFYSLDLRATAYDSINVEISE